MGALGQEDKSVTGGLGEFGRGQRRIEAQVYFHFSCLGACSSPVFSSDWLSTACGFQVCALWRSKPSVMNGNFLYSLFLSPGKLTVELGKFWVPCPLCWLWARWVTHDRSRGSVILGPLWRALNHSDLILYSALCTSCLSPYQMDVCTPAKEV